MTDYLKDPLYRKVFFEDTDRLLDSFRQNIVLLTSNSDNQAALTQLHNSAHSLKGTAAVMGLNALSALAGKMEADLKLRLKTESYDLPSDIVRAIAVDIQQVDGMLKALKIDLLRADSGQADGTST